ncbi:hypothetical protein [Agromyces sp. NPDC060279]|uniref:hypothetical protein n=1 Tax=Agromyces sp. NPDC060279 TaxID=3347092 RepID=UPI00365F4DFF
MRTRIVIGAIGALAASWVLTEGSAIGSSSAVAEVGPSMDSAENAECIQRDENGQQRWFGEPSRELLEAADALQALVDSSPEAATGVAFCSEYDGAVIFLAPGAPESLLASVDGVLRAYPAQSLSVAESVAPLSDLLSISSQIMADFTVARGLVSVGPDLTTGGLEIGYDPEVWPTEAGLRASLLAALAAMPEGSFVSLRLTPEGGSQDSTRRADSESYWMGAELGYDHGGSSYVCSAGVPINVNGSRKLLTAGHCLGSTFVNDGNVVGTTYTTAYPGNAAAYGDWKIIHGKKYGMSVFSGVLASNDRLPISGAYWGGRPAGLQVCVSGRTTAQTCRYFVTGSHLTFTVGGVTASHQLRMYHDSNLDGVGDRAGWTGGDSGGPCYYADGAGGVIVTGIVKGRSVPPSGAATYYCTQLSGVRAWNAGASVG